MGKGGIPHTASIKKTEYFNRLKMHRITTMRIQRITYDKCIVVVDMNFTDSFISVDVVAYNENDTIMSLHTTLWKNENTYYITGYYNNKEGISPRLIFGETIEIFNGVGNHFSELDLNCTKRDISHMRSIMGDIFFGVKRAQLNLEKTEENNVELTESDINIFSGEIFFTVYRYKTNF